MGMILAIRRALLLSSSPLLTSANSPTLTLFALSVSQISPWRLCVCVCQIRRTARSGRQAWGTRLGTATIRWTTTARWRSTTRTPPPSLQLQLQTPTTCPRRLLLLPPLRRRRQRRGLKLVWRWCTGLTRRKSLAHPAASPPSSKSSSKSI